MKNEIEEQLRELKQMGTKYLRLIIIDIHGVPRSILIKREKFEEALSYGVGFDGSSIPGYTRIENSDLIAIPDPSTLIEAIWEDNRTAVVICDTYTPEYKPFIGDPRVILKKIVSSIEEKEMKVKTGVELEFFIVNRESGLEKISTQDNGQYMDSNPIDYGDSIKKYLGEILHNCSIDYEKLHHEVAPGQHELAITATNPIELADKIILTKMIVKTIIKKNGYTATFMPKPFIGINGSGAHIHVSLNKEDYGNLFYAHSKNDISEIAKQFIAGILKHAKSLSLILNPTINSYKRLAPGYEAPVHICWGYSNRSTLIRIPRPIREKNCRIEYRQPDPSFNPYLGLAAIIAAGIWGVNNKISPIPPCHENAYHFNENFEVLPSNLYEAIEEFKKNKVIQEALGKHSASKLIEVKLKEWEDYINHEGPWNKNKNKITKWEIEKYLERV